MVWLSPIISLQANGIFFGGDDYFISGLIFVQMIEDMIQILFGEGMVIRIFHLIFNRYFTDRYLIKGLGLAIPVTINAAV